MTAHAQATRMRAIGNDRNQLRFNRRIDFDLRIAVVGIPIDILNRLLGRIDAHLGRPRKLASAVDDAGFQHARPEFAAIIEARYALQESVGIVGHVSRASHTVSEIEWTIDVTEMLVVVPQPRHKKAAMW